MNNVELPNQSHTPMWMLYVKASFAIAVASLVAFTLLSGQSLMFKGFLMLNGMFLISTTMTLSKTMRDEHENQRLLNRISEAKTNKMIKEYAE